mgnify:CR=1 FL=1
MRRLIRVALFQSGPILDLTRRAWTGQARRWVAYATPVRRGPTALTSSRSELLVSSRDVTTILGTKYDFPLRSVRGPEASFSHVRQHVVITGRDLWNLIYRLWTIRRAEDVVAGVVEGVNLS